MRKVREERKSVFYKGLLFGVISIGILSFAYYCFVHQRNQVTQFNYSPSHRPKAAIVDHLSITFPNQVFVEECSSLLREAGFDVDYYKGDNATVELYKNLPGYGYDLIVFRVHLAYHNSYKNTSLAMFTSEPYSTRRYIYEQLDDRVGRGWLAPYRKGDPYLVVNDKFVRFSTYGEFKDTLIIMMGCSGLKQNVLAAAFLEKGAKAYIGWNGPVTAAHTDKATIQFLKHFLIERQTIAKALEQTREEVGYESQYRSTLVLWPLKEEEFIFKNISSTVDRGIVPSVVSSSTTAA